jgi:PBP1b-binding outer membrane lipoprotein LpoB
LGTLFLKNNKYIGINNKESFYGEYKMKYTLSILLVMLLAGCTQSTPDPVAHFKTYNYVYKSTGTIERVQRKHFVIPYTKVIKANTNIQHRVIE